VVIDLGSQPPAALVGAKAARLGWLLGRGWPVPAGMVVPFEIGAALARGTGATGPAGMPGGDPAAALQGRLAEVIDPTKSYAVRSSADVEDHGSRSFAGQFATVLGVTGVDDVLSAMCQVASSSGTVQVADYARRVDVDPAGIRMAVIVQELVRPVVSGVAFSRDPVTGADRVIVEAVRGAGEQLVGRGATPQRWVHEPRGVITGPVESEPSREVVAEVVETVRAIAAASGEPADVEWVWDGQQVWLVQWRPVTALGRQARVWSSRIAKAVLPGLIPPLVWSVNVPVVNAVWVGILDDALGATGLDPESLARSFGYRAYFDMGAFGSVFASLGLPPDALEQMRAGTGRPAMRPSFPAVARRAPRLVRFVAGLRSWPRVARSDLRTVEAAREREAAVDLGSLSDDDLLARVDRLRGLLGVAARLNVVTPLLADASAASVRRAAVRRGLEPTEVDPGQGLGGVRALDPAHALGILDPGDERAWAAFLEKFGHLSDSPNDCSRPTWAEQPETVRHLLEGSRSADGRTRVATLGHGRAELLARTPRWRRPAVSRAWRRAAGLRVAREHVGYAYARVYALFRPTFLEIGARLTARGALTERDDVFMLTLDEVRDAVTGVLPGAPALAARRRLEMAEAAEVDWPEVILGDDPVPVLGRGRARVLAGTPTSRGRHTGPARVVTSLATAPDIGPEDVLVLESADVTWTPLLLRAGAVVTETGGMLSHASIVARELGLPCVASVDGATRVPEGAILSVDGGSGEVLVLDRDDRDTEESR
jgi:pyruvate,water dikinase